MTIAFHPLQDYKVALRKLIRSSEGFDGRPVNIGDLTVTFGMGYTFIRGGGVYEHLDEDLAAIGIVLSTTQKIQLADIAQLRSKYQSTSTPEEDKPAIRESLNTRIQLKGSASLNFYG